MAAAENALRIMPQLPAARQRVQAKLEIIIQMVMRPRRIADHMRVFGHISGDRIEPVPVADARARPVPMEQVLLNLVGNACDAHAGGEGSAPERLMAITASVDDAWGAIGPQDNAGGIPPAILDRIFQPFFATKSAGKGIGLGLRLSYGIVTELGGTLSAVNRNGGACFTIRPPRRWARGP